MKIPNHKHWFALNAINTDKGEISLYNDIGLFGISADSFLEMYKQVENVNDLTVRISSYGGDIATGLMIRNRLKEHKAKNKTIIIDSLAASIAADIAMLPKFKVKIYRNAFIAIHKPMGGAYGSADDLRNTATSLDMMQEEIINDYKEKTKGKISVDLLNEKMNQTTWFNAKQALKYGFVDEIIDEDSENEEPVTSSSNRLPSKFTNIFLNKGVNKMKICPICGKSHDGENEMCVDCIGKFQNLLKAPAQPPAAPVVPSVNNVPPVPVPEPAKPVDSIAAERNRITTIQNHCHELKLPEDFIKTLVDSGETLDQASEKITNKLRETNTNKPAPIVIVDQADKFREKACNTLQVRLNLTKDKEVINNVRKDPGPSDLHGLIGECLINEGKMSVNKIVRLTPEQLADEAIRMCNDLGSSDLPFILADTMNKAFNVSPAEAGATFDQVCAVDETSDFRNKSYVKLSSVGDIDNLPEGMAFKQGTFSDAQEQIKVSTMGKVTTISRQMMVNNNTFAISQIPGMYVRACWNKANRVCYDLLTVNTLAGPTLLEDKKAVFHADHGNILTGKGVPSVASIDAIEQALYATKLMKAKKDDPDTFVSGGIQKILTGTMNKLTLLQVLRSTFDPSKANNQVFNPYSSGIVPVFDPYLQSKLTAAGKPYAQYGFADPNMFPTLTVLYLSGNRTPSIRSEASAVGAPQGISYEFYFDIGFGFQDYRGLILNDGTTSE
jgi:ATP-dependent protease ClpP protease subunit